MPTLTHSHDAYLADRQVASTFKVTDGGDAVRGQVFETGAAPVTLRLYRSAFVRQQNGNTVLLQVIRQREIPVIIAHARTRSMNKHGGRIWAITLGQKQHAGKHYLMGLVAEADLLVSGIFQAGNLQTSFFALGDLGEDNRSNDEK